MKLLDPTIHILYLFSATLGEGVGLVSSKCQPLPRLTGLITLNLPGIRASEGYFRWIRCPPCRVYHSEVHDVVSLIQVFQTAKATKADHDALVDLFERVGSFLKRLKIYSGIQLTTEIKEVSGEIMVEVLSILALSTKEMKRGRTSESLFHVTLSWDASD